MIDFDRQVRALSGKALRMVEAQHQISTLQLVDSVEEQEVLEQLIDAVKPPRPTGPEFDGLHYLLATPFRYPPLRYGTRFGRRSQRGLFYAARRPRTVMAEVAYYRLWFLSGTAAEIDHVETEHTLFRVSYRTRRGVDLTRPEFVDLHKRLVSRTSYRTTQKVGDALRAAQVAVFRAQSARDVEGGTNIGVLTPAAFTSKQPDHDTQTWVCVTTSTQVLFRRRDLLAPEQFVFPRTDFLVGGRLPQPPG